MKYLLFLYIMLMGIVKNKRFIYVTSCGCMKLFLYHKNYTPRKSSALQWRWGLCDPKALRAILVEASASGRSYQARQVKGQDLDKQMIESLAVGRGQCSQADKTWCILAESYCCSGENTATVGSCCVHQLSNQQPKEIPKRFDQ